MRRILSLALLAVMLATTGSLAATLSTKTVLTLDAAKEIAAAAAQHARDNNWNVVIAIVDDGGNLVYLERMDDAQIASVDIAIGKAKTAIGFKRPSRKLGEAIAGGRPELVTLDAKPFDGGYPLIFGDEFVGAIGISGVTSTQDGYIALAGVEYLAGLADE